MQTESTVRVIPPRATHITTNTNVAVHKKKVASYARVSTDFEEQQTSYKAQVDHYTKYIKENFE